MILKRADESRMSTSKRVLRLLMEAKVLVPTMKVRVNGYFCYHT